MASRPCDHCGKSFEPRRVDHRSCSSKCRLEGFLAQRAVQQQERNAAIRRKLREALDLLTDDNP